MKDGVKNCGHLSADGVLGKHTYTHSSGKPISSSLGGDFAFRGTFDNIWEIFYYSMMDGVTGV